MPVVALQHFNIRCADAAKTRDFYVGLLGLVQGPRPPFASQGYWLYLDEDPVVHLVQRPESEAHRRPETGNLDHIAFEGADLEATRRYLRENGLAFHEALVPRDNVTQIFVHDPDGIKLELNFAPPRA